MHRLTRALATILGGAMLLGAACARHPEGTTAPDSAAQPGPASGPVTDSGASVPSASPAGDTSGAQARIARLEREARALASTAGCSKASDCRAAPVGWRACGGPRTYLVYCAATTDSAKLFRKLAELEAAEKAYIEKSGMMSTCEFRTPPGTTLQGGSCREAPARP